MKAGDTLADHAMPMDNIINQLTQTLKEFAQFKQQNPDYTTMKKDYQQMKNRIKELESGQC
jgi:cell shape-determining protein MreC